MKNPISSREELDLAIPQMDTLEAEQKVREILHALPGVRAVRLIERGAWIEYDGDIITHGEVEEALRQGGVRVGLFQDSASGETGTTKV